MVVVLFAGFLLSLNKYSFIMVILVERFIIRFTSNVAAAAANAANATATATAADGCGIFK